MNFNLKTNSLKFKVLFWFIGITSILLFLFSFLLYYFLEQSINLRIETNLYQNSIKIYDQLKENKHLKFYSIKAYQYCVLKDDKIIYKTKDFSIDLKKYIDKDKIFFVNEISEYEIDATYILKFNTPFNGSIIIKKQGISNKAEDVEDILLFLNPLLLLVLLFIGNKLVDKVLNPIKKITTSAKNITIDNFSHTIDIPNASDEIKELIQTFNEMIYRLQSQVELLDRFNSDISHELRIPLTVIQGELELALRKSRDQEYYKHSINIILNQTKNLYSLVEALLLLTKYDKQNILDTFEPSILDSILLNVCEKYEQILKDKNISLEILKLESISLNANQFLINSIFSNLLDNAIKYTPNNKKITISLYKDEKTIYFIVKDEGIGIEQDQISKITNRFYRVDQSRNRSIKGFGLGLSIVDNAVKLHNGTINIASKPNQGTTVTITF